MRRDYKDSKGFARDREEGASLPGSYYSKCGQKVKKNRTWAPLKLSLLKNEKPKSVCFWALAIYV